MVGDACGILSQSVTVILPWDVYDLSKVFPLLQRKSHSPYRFLTFLSVVLNLEMQPPGDWKRFTDYVKT